MHWPLTQTSRLSPFKSKLQSIMLSATSNPDTTPPSSCINMAWGSYHSLKQIKQNDCVFINEHPKNVLTIKFSKPTTTWSPVFYPRPKYSRFPHCSKSIRIRAKPLYQKNWSSAWVTIWTRDSLCIQETTAVGNLWWLGGLCLPKQVFALDHDHNIFSQFLLHQC